MAKANPRSLVGMLGLLAGLLVYTTLVAALADWLLPLPLLFEILYFTVFGIAWIFPARGVLNWIKAGQADA